MPAVSLGLPPGVVDATHPAATPQLRDSQGRLSSSPTASAGLSSPGPKTSRGIVGRCKE